jgi:hypothetical protein
MSKARRVTANLSRLVRQRRAHDRAMALRGKIRLDVDLNESRERRR